LVTAADLLSSAITMTTNTDAATLRLGSRPSLRRPRKARKKPLLHDAAFRPLDSSRKWRLRPLP
jgi:hypothetical protein